MGCTVSCKTASFELIVRSQRKVELVPYPLVIGSKVFLDRDYTFRTVSKYPDNTVFLRISNDDKLTPANRVQFQLSVSRPVRVYLDFWGGPTHASRGFAKWQDGWEISNQAPTAFGSSWGPGVVYTKCFDAGSIQLYGNDGGCTGGSHGSYYVFVCPGISVINAATNGVIQAR